MSTAEAAAVSLDSYNEGGHVDDDNNIEEKVTVEAVTDVSTALITPSEGRAMRRESSALISR